MKKVFLLFSALTLLLVSCNKETTEETDGTVTISVEYVNKLITPEIAMGDLGVRLTGTATIERQMPEDGKLTEIPAGSYKLLITNNTEKSAPSFDPEYSFEETITVTGGKDTAVAAKMKQTSAGIYFVYEGTEGVTPEAAITAGSLKYEGADKEAVGYFTPGATTVTVTSGGHATEINGQPGLIINTNEGIHYEVLLAQTHGGVTAVVYKYDTVTGEELGIDAPGELSMEFTGAAGVYYGATENGTGRFTITFTAGDGAAQFVMEAYSDMFADPDAFGPATGAYSVSDTEKLFGVSAGKVQGEELSNTYYRFSKDGKTYSAVTIGEGDIILGTKDGNYTMAANLKGKETLYGYDLSKISFSFEGAVEFVNESPAIEFVEDSMPSLMTYYYAPHRQYEHAMLEFEIMADIPGAYDCMVVRAFVDVPEGDPERAVYEGLYRYSPAQTPLTFAPGYIDEEGEPRGTYSYKAVNENGVTVLKDIVLLDGGTVSMKLAEPYNPEWRNQKYEVLVYGTGMDTETGQRTTVAYKSLNHVPVIDNTPGEDELYNMEFTEASSVYYGDYPDYGFSNSTIQFTVTKDNIAYYLQFDLYMEMVDGRLEIVPGTYTASSERTKGIFYKGFFDPKNGLVLSCMTALDMNNWTAPISAGITGGTLGVTRDGDNYSFDIQVTGVNYTNKDSYITVNGSYEGEVKFSSKRGSPMSGPKISTIRTER